MGLRSFKQNSSKPFSKLFVSTKRVQVSTKVCSGKRGFLRLFSNLAYALQSRVSMESTMSNHSAGRKPRLLDRIRMVVDYENSRTQIAFKNTGELERIESVEPDGFDDFHTNVSTIKVALPSSVLFRRS